MSIPPGPVLVVRPEPGASATAARLRAMGREALVVPLLATEPIEGPLPAPRRSFDAIVLTSAAAARELARRDLPSDLRGRTVHTIGEATAHAASCAGLARVVVGANGTAPADGTALGTMLAPLYRGRSLLYPCAEDRRPGLAAALREGGVDVTAWPLYRTVALPDALSRLEESTLHAPPTAVLLHSPSAARALGDRPLSGVPLLCLSRAVADAVPPGTGGERRVAAEPTEAALLALLDPQVDP